MRPQLIHPVTVDREGYTRAALRGFHANPNSEAAQQMEAPVAAHQVPERMFGHRINDTWVSTAFDFERTLTVPGGRAPVAAVSGVTVTPTWRRQGLLTELMTAQLRATAKRGEIFSYLYASESAIYGRFGYGSTSRRYHVHGDTRDLGLARKPAEGHTEELLGAADEVVTRFAAAASAVHDETVAATPGALDRPAAWWTTHLGQLVGPQDTFLRYLLDTDAKGVVRGFAIFSVDSTWERPGPNGEVTVHDLEALDAESLARLWRFLTQLDLVRRVSWRRMPLDSPLPWLLANQRALVSDLDEDTYLRLVDVPRALATRRYRGEVSTVIEVRDELLPSNAGCFELITGEQPSVRRVDRPAELSLDIRELGSVYLAGVTLTQLHRAGLVECRDTEVLEGLSTAFGWERAPYCPDIF